MAKSATMERSARPEVSTWPDRTWRDIWGFDLRPWLEGFRVPMLMEDIRVEVRRSTDELLVRAEVPGIDPGKDCELVVRDGMLVIKVERRQEETGEAEGMTRSEFRYGMFERALALPKGVHPEAVTADYADGILTVHVPLPDEQEQTGTKVPITT